MHVRLLVLMLGLAALPAQEPAKLTAFAFSCRTLGGQAITQDTFKDNVLIVDLWGTWCPPCRAAIPKLVELYERYKHHGVEIVGFNYKADGGGESVETVREFAVANRITYSLAIGEAAVRDQVSGFSGYPTLLMFKKGLVHDETRVGFQDGDEDQIEGWIRKALELDKPDTTQKQRDADREKAAVAKEQVPDGKIFMPGNGDLGFDFETEDLDGKPLAFKAMRGKPVLLALTTTWDQEAGRTAALLEGLRKDHPDLQIVAACMERTRDPDKRREALTAFRSEQKIGYTLFAADLAFSGKVHLFAALPTLLLFDAEGKLIARESGLSEETAGRLRERLLAPGQGK